MLRLRADTDQPPAERFDEKAPSVKPECDGSYQLLTPAMHCDASEGNTWPVCKAKRQTTFDLSLTAKLLCFADKANANCIFRLN
jgi:hypothetical protein